METFDIVSSSKTSVCSTVLSFLAQNFDSKIPDYEELLVPQHARYLFYPRDK